MSTSGGGRRRVVITGMGVVSSAGVGVPALLDTMLEAVSRERLMPEFERFDMRSSIYGPVPDFDPEAVGLPADFVARNDRYAWFGLAASAMGQSA